jgi:hypothetical protein
MPPNPRTRSGARARACAVWLGCSVLGAGAVAHAQGASPPVGLVVALEMGSDIDVARLRDAIARELGTRVVVDPNAKGGALVVRQQGGMVAVSFEAPDRRIQGRSMTLPADPDEAVRDIALLAGNIARDQATPFIRHADDRVPSPAQAPAPQPIGRDVPAIPRERIFAGVDFAPFVGSSTTAQGRTATRRLSLGVIGTLSGGVDGVAMSSVVNVEGGSVRGGELAGFANIASGPMTGVECAGAANVSLDSASGLQASGAANVALGPMRGVQAAGAANVGLELHGAQISGAVNVTGAMVGAQISGGFDVATEARGVQIAPVNIASGRVHGVQIGVVNYAQESDFSLGVVNILTKGRLKTELWGLPEAGMLLFGVKNGGVHFHYIYALGVRPADTNRPWGALGLGAHMTPSADVFVDADLLAHMELVVTSDHRNELYQARVLVGYHLFPQLAAYAGPTFNVLFANDKGRIGAAPGYSAVLAETSRSALRGWPGITIGLEAL